jgi:hypothetical protein
VALAIQNFTYTPSGVIAIFNGHIIQGISADSSISVSRSSNMFEVVPGIDGSWSRIKTSNFSGTITVNIHQTSPSNDALGAFATADEINESGSGLFLLKDKSGHELVTAAVAFIQKRPDLSYSTSMGERTWVFASGYIDIVNGANG